VQILTALHNVLVWRELSASPQDAKELKDLLDGFGAALTVYYGPGDMSFNAKPTASCTNSQGNQKNTVVIPKVEGACSSCANKNVPSLYDVAVITCTEKAFADYVTKSVLPKDYNFLKEVGPLLKATRSALDSKVYAHIQLGYGKTKDPRDKVTLEETNKIKSLTNVTMECAKELGMTDYHLHYRVTAPANESMWCMVDLEKPKKAKVGDPTSYTAYSHAIELKTTEGTSAEGDSGGPLYAVKIKDKSKVYLLGVTTGADMQAAVKPPDKLFFNDISTSVIPYFETLVPKPPAGAQGAGGKAPAGGAKTPAAGTKTPAAGTKTPDAGTKTPTAGATTPKKT
jgi:hypothetical protein